MNLTALNEPASNLCADKECIFSFFPYGITACDAAFLFGVIEVSVLIFLLYWIFCRYKEQRFRRNPSKTETEVDGK